LSEGDARTESPHSSRRAASADPPLLLPAALHPVAGTSGKPSARSPVVGQPFTASPLATSGAAADEATEVHIHIGRIDVTAVREAPRVRATSSAKSPTLSLDAYLAGRGRA
jgi:hypothetical protein